MLPDCLAGVQPAFSSSTGKDRGLLIIRPRQLRCFQRTAFYKTRKTAAVVKFRQKPGGGYDKKQLKIFFSFVSAKLTVFEYILAYQGVA